MATTHYKIQEYIENSIFALNYPDGSKCWSKQNAPILSLCIKHLRVHARIDEYRAERIPGCMEQKNHHHTEIDLLFKDLCFFFFLNQELQVTLLILGKQNQQGKLEYSFPIPRLD